MKEQRVNKISEGMKMLVAEIQDHWSVNAVRVTFNAGIAKWLVEGKCGTSGHPVEQWSVGEFYTLGSGPDLATAIHTALVPR